MTDGVALPPQLYSEHELTHFGSWHAYTRQLTGVYLDSIITGASGNPEYI